MKTKFIGIVGFLAGIFLTVSCQPPVVFGEPQPADVEPLTYIPKDYRGIYWCMVDSASLYIDDQSLVRRKEFFIKTTKSEIDEDPDLELINGQLYVKDWEGFFPTTEKGDTLISQIIMRDTIFKINDDQMVKPFKGHLILNLKLNDNAWDVMVVSRKTDALITIATAKIPENIAQLDSITPIKSLRSTDSVQTQIYLKPTALEFARIFDKGLLFDGSCMEYERIFPLKQFVN